MNEVVLNPCDTNPPTQVTALSIPSELFKPNGGPLSKSYMLLVHVLCPNNISKEADVEPTAKKMKTSKIYGSTLIVYDKHGRCLLTEGEYELRLQEIVCNIKSKNHTHKIYIIKFLFLFYIFSSIAKETSCLGNNI